MKRKLLRVATGNMYDFVTHTWNPVKGICYHQCRYCYMNCFRPEKYECAPVMVDDEFEIDLNVGKVIFVGDGIDLFAQNIPDEWILRVLDHCAGFNDQRVGQKKIVFLFQSKNPSRFLQFLDHRVFKHSVIGTTIETNRYYPEVMMNSPRIEKRADAMKAISEKGFYTMITLEPLLAFDKTELVEIIRQCNPRFINIGRESKRKVWVPEPTSAQVKELVAELREITNVKIKSNAKSWL
jgi:DNA repair photolyase